MTRMTRREFTAAAGASALALAAGAAPRPAAASDDLRGGGRVGQPLGPEEGRILSLASLAPNGHNTQPWAVRVKARDRWTVGVDPERRLPAVDPSDRETVISLGTFLENLVVGARALGREIAMEVLSEKRDAAELYEVRLSPRPAEDGGAVARIEARRTLRKGYRSDPLAAADRDAILAAAGPAAFFPAGTREARWLREAAVESFTFQSWRDDAQRELQKWIRFAPEEVRRRRDGLNPRTMEAGLFARFYMEHFMDASSVMTKGFRERGVEMLAEQARGGAGFLVLWSRDDSVPALLDAGRRWERVALMLRERKLAMAPMSQMLEEERWREKVRAEIGADGSPQAVLRVGAVDALPPPVSPRRPLADFVRIVAGAGR
jgi:hypothetical protein